MDDILKEIKDITEEANSINLDFLPKRIVPLRVPIEETKVQVEKEICKSKEEIKNEELNHEVDMLEEINEKPEPKPKHTQINPAPYLSYLQSLQGNP